MEKNIGNNIILELGKMAVDGFYDFQELRLSEHNRMRDVIRRKIEDIPYDKPEDKKEEKKYLEKYKDKNISYMIEELKDKNKLGKSELYYIDKLVDLSKEVEGIELRHKNLMDKYLQFEPMWEYWLKNIKGISTVLAGNLLKNFNYCEKYQYVSSLWRHCGLDPDGAKGRRKGKEIHYNPKLKTLAWKIGDSFIKQRTPVYRRIYDNEKVRQRSLHPEAIDNPVYLETKKGFKKLYTDMHIHRMAMRKMVKIFLQHYWLIGRKFKKLEVSDPYPIDRLGHKTFIEPPNDPFK